MEELNNIDLTKEQLKIVRGLLQQYIPQAQVWAYGSRVKWTSTTKSDLDIVAFIEENHKKNISMLRDAFEESSLPFRVDLFVWNEVPEQFHRNIKEHYFTLQLPTSSPIIPNDWKKVKLSDVCAIKYGKDHKHLSKGQIPCYGSGGIMRYVSTPLYNGKSVLIPRKGSLNNLFFVDIPFWTVDTLFYTQIDENKVSSKHLYYKLKTLKLVEMNVGTAVPSLTTAILNDIELDLPPLSEQKAIASVLGALDDKIELNNRINANLEAQAQAIFKSWFVDFEPWGGVMPDDWKVGVFKDIISATLSGDWGKENQTGNNTQEVYCIRGADITEINAGNKGKMPIRYILPNNYSAKKLTDGDIVIEISGGSPTQSTGRCALITSSLLNRYDRKMVCTNFCRAVKPLDGYSSFIYFYWKHLYSQNVMFVYENGTTGIKNFDIASFLEIEQIVIPTKEVIYKFADVMKEFTKKNFFNGLMSERLALLRDTLLPKLLSGEIRINYEEKP